MAPKNDKAWGGRFSEKTAPLMERFNASIPFDYKLAAVDIQGSRAHAKMLARMGLLSKAELSKIEKGLTQIAREIAEGRFEFRLADEDIHMAIEKRLTALIGPTGGKLHTARSRNDQVALDIRLYAREAVKRLQEKTLALIDVFVALAEKNKDTVLPGYTHLQRAQPILLAHHLLAYAFMAKRDHGRLTDLMPRLNRSPLGAGALAGTTLPIDREFVAKELGFDGVTENSLDSVSDRDFALEILASLSIQMMHISRLAEELVLWSSQEFGFVALPQGFCTGSSMMPQKVNPDAAELLRGKTGRVYGDLLSLLTTMKGLPLTYNKDMQEDKEPLFDALETAELSLDVLLQMLPGLQFKKEKMERATKEGFVLATDLADYLVEKGLPFREAHRVIGELVQHAIREKTVLEDLSLDIFKRFSPIFEKDVEKILSIKTSINRRKSTGGTALSEVNQQIKMLKNPRAMP